MNTYPVMIGLLMVLAFLSLTTLMYCLLGMGKGEALYFAGLTFAVLSYAASRRVIRRK